MTIVFMTLSGILQYDMIDYYLFVTYVICVRDRFSKLGWGGYYYYVLTLCFLRFVLLFHYWVISVRYFSYYTIVAYAICVMISVGR